MVYRDIDVHFPSEGNNTGGRGKGGGSVPLLWSYVQERVCVGRGQESIHVPAAMLLYIDGLSDWLCGVQHSAAREPSHPSPLPAIIVKYR